MSSNTITIEYEDIDGPSSIEASYLGGGDVLIVRDTRDPQEMFLSQEGALALIQALADLATVRAELRPA